MLNSRSASQAQVASYVDWCLEAIRSQANSGFSQIQWLKSDLGECARAFCRELPSGDSFGFFRSLLSRHLLTRHGTVAPMDLELTTDQSAVLASFSDFATAAINRKTSQPLDWDRVRAETRKAKKAVSQVRSAMRRQGWSVTGPRGGLIQALQDVGEFRVRSNVQVSPGALLCWNDLESEGQSRILLRDSQLARLGIADQTDLRALDKKDPDEIIAFVLREADRFVTFVNERLPS